MGVRVPARGKALANWARPAIDELGVPTEPWKQVHDKLQSKYLLQLLTGVTVFSVSFGYLASIIEMNPTPKHLKELDLSPHLHPPLSSRSLTTLIKNNVNVFARHTNWFATSKLDQKGLFNIFLSIAVSDLTISFV